MPVHNARPYVDSAVESILAQSFKDFEFLIFDDGSSDGSLERLRWWTARDSRIRLIESERNLGPVGSSNTVAAEATAPLVARMDADDVSHPLRLETQVQVFAERPDIGLVGTLCDSIDARGRRLRGPDLWRLTRQAGVVPFPHGSTMYRRELFERIGGYRKECEFWEDQDLVLRASRIAKVATIPLALYGYRHSPVSTRLTSNLARVEACAHLGCQAMDALKRGTGYDGLLAAPTPDRIDPRVFVSLGSIALWGGGRPSFIGRFLRRARLRPDPVTFAAFVWTVWAAIEPCSLRQLMKGIAAVRNSLSEPDPDSGLVEWRPYPLRPEITGAAPAAVPPMGWQPAAE